MKGKTQQRALYLQIRKNMVVSKPKEKREAYSYFQIPTENNKVPVPSAPLNMYQMQLTTNRKISSVYPSNLKPTSLVPGTDDKFLHMRKENYLNTCYNSRKNRLKQISKENKQILKRINSQKSMYSSTDLNKSFENNTQIKKRLSQSKLSQRLKSSRSSERGSINGSQYRKSETKKKEVINIKASNINNAKLTDLKGFQTLFNNKVKVKQERQSYFPPSSTFTTINNKDQQSSKGSSRQNYRKTLPVINREQKKMALSQPKELGGILHRIAEVMYTVQEEPSPKKFNGYFKSKKTVLI